MNTALSQKTINTIYGVNLFEDISLFRNIALEIDKAPENISQYLASNTITHMCKDRGSSCLDRTKYLEALSYGDAGVLLASPGPSLAGLMVRELGNNNQQEVFFNYIEAVKSTTFLAVTEPNYGSNAGEMKAFLSSDGCGGYLLNAEKWLVGHGADASTGVIIARVSTGPLGIVAIQLTPEILHSGEQNGTIFRNHLDTIGLNGARLSRLIFKDCKISKDHILGNHLRVVNRGMMALLKTFNRMRPAVAGFALGHAQAVLDYIECNNGAGSQYNYQCKQFQLDLQVIRELLYSAASDVDNDPFLVAKVSLAKFKATQAAEIITRTAIDIFSRQDLWEHPFLIKWSRDVWGYEYMEGTSNIQRKNVYNGYIKNDFKNFNQVDGAK